MTSNVCLLKGYPPDIMDQFVSITCGGKIFDIIKILPHDKSSEVQLTNAINYLIKSKGSGGKFSLTC